MTVETPFPSRLPTPFWSPRGPMGMMGMGDDTTIGTTVQSALTDATAAYIATVNAPQQVGVSATGAPITYNPATGLTTVAATPTVAANSSGLVMVLIVGALIYFASKGGRF